MREREKHLTGARVKRVRKVDKGQTTLSLINVLMDFALYHQNNVKTPHGFKHGWEIKIKMLYIFPNIYVQYFHMHF